VCAAVCAAGPAAFSQPASVSFAPSSGSYLHVEGSGSFRPAQFSATAWIRPTAAGINGGGTVISCGQVPGVAYYGCSWWYGWTASSTKLVGMVVNQYGVLGRVVEGVGTAPLNQWTHTALTFDGTTLRLYLNGVLDSELAYGYSGIDYRAAPEINIGHFLDGPAYTYNHLDGQLDDATIWSRALSAAEIFSLAHCEPAPDAEGLLLYLPFTDASPADRSPAAHPVTPVLAPGYSTNPPALGARPTITSGPTSTSVCPGATAVFTVTGTAPPLASYQWRKGAANINTTLNPSAATPTLTLSSVSLADAADYSCTLTGASGCGAITSAAARLYVDPADIGTTGGTAGHDNLHDNNDFVVFIDFFFNHNPAADLGSTGGILGPDDVFDNNDFVVFIDQFFAGCP